MTPEQTLTAAAERIRAGDWRIGHTLADALAEWLKAAAARERANETAAARVYTSPADQAAWLEDHRDHEALAVAHQILGDQP